MAIAPYADENSGTDTQIVDLQSLVRNLPTKRLARALWYAGQYV